MMRVLPAGERWSSWLLAGVIVAATLGLLGSLIHELIDLGPFGWHLGRPQTWQGGLEVLALIALLATCATMSSPRWRALALIAIGEAYLRRHFVDVPIFLDVIYVEALIGLGAGVARVCGLRRADDLRTYLVFALAGVIVWSFGAWILSAFGVGSLRAMRYYFALTAIIAFSARQTPLSVFLWRRFGTLGTSERACVSALAAWFLCLAARTNIVSGFDAWWYGLRGDFVLVAGGSAFKSLDLVAPVNYYPKLYELMLIPLSGLHDFSVIEGLSICMLALLAIACMQMLATLGLGFRTRLLFTALVATVPAIANAALSPKPDVFSAWLLVVACIEADRFARTGSVNAVTIAIAGCLAAFASKLSAPPFIVAIGVAAIGVWLHRGRPRMRDSTGEFRFALAIGVAAVVVTTLVTARTVLLAGVPMIAPEQAVDLFAKMGMTLKPGIGLLAGGPPPDWHGLPALLRDQLFRPQLLGHMVITWFGNVWLYLFALAVLARIVTMRRNDDAPRVPWVWWAILIAGVLVLLAYRNPERGGDGNYFVLPLTFAMLLGGYAAWARLPPGMPRRLLLATLPLFVLIQASYSFLSAGWSSGTRTFDLDFRRSVRDTRLQNRLIFQQNGIAGIAEYLRAVHGIPRAVGYVSDGPAFRLPATFETMNFYEYWNRAPLESAEVFIDFLREHRIDYLVLPKANATLKREVAPSVRDAAAELADEPGVRIVKDRAYTLYDLAELHAAARGTR